MTYDTNKASAEEPVFWHLADTNEPCLLLHNAYVGKGKVSTASWCAKDLPGIASSYQAFHLDKEKEALWEDVRRESFPHLPSRMGAIFLFCSEADLFRAKQRWDFTNRVAVRALPVPGSKVFRADSRWLDDDRERWSKAARHYWLSEMTADPLWEIIVHGFVFFPDWNKPPFGDILTSQQK